MRYTFTLLASLVSTFACAQTNVDFQDLSLPGSQARPADARDAGPSALERRPQRLRRVGSGRGVFRAR